jgi:uncharacterized membrane protein
MRSKVLWFLLAASLALNVFFVAGVVYPQLVGQRHPAQWRDPVAAATREFSLDDRQAAALEALRNRLAERRNDSRGGRDGFRSIILDALREPAFDRAALTQALDQRREGSGNMVIDMTEDLHGFLAGLTPEQKTAFLEHAVREHDFLRRLLFPPRAGRGRHSAAQ